MFVWTASCYQVDGCLYGSLADGTNHKKMGRTKVKNILRWNRPPDGVADCTALKQVTCAATAS